MEMSISIAMTSIRKITAIVFYHKGVLLECFLDWGNIVTAVCYCGAIGGVTAGHSSQKASVVLPSHHHFAL
jgi:hypothetical protein